ncbi:hypothetical protein Avbf_07854 [Armadillidium vulgare]|nr:hypothetical protein Avbf_07854 [Armadillidium vulgare]
MNEITFSLYPSIENIIINLNIIEGYC